jgi:hypothetical protein
LASLSSTQRRAPAEFLNHPEGGAKFDPVSLGASLPARVADDPHEVTLAYVHEYVHFIQSVSTLFGLARMHTAWRGFRHLQDDLRAAAGVLSATDFTLFRKHRAEALDGLSALSKDDPVHREHGPGLKTSQILYGLQDIAESTDNDRFVAYAMPVSDEGFSWIQPIGTLALQESMAMAIECLADRLRTHEVFEFAKSDHEQGGFDYAVVQVALSSVLPSACEELLHGLTVVTCDIALDSMAPTLAWMRCAQWLKSRNDVPKEFDLGWLLAIHSCLTHECAAFAAPEMRDAWLSNLRRARHHEQERPLAAYLDLFISAARIKANRPSAFVEQLLTLNGDCPEDMREFFGLPYYSARGHFVTLRPDDDLPTAGLMMMSLQHFAACVAEAKLAQSLEGVCPFRDHLAMCQNERGPHCSQTPWFAPIVEGESGPESCIYRASTDFLGVKA